MVRMKRKNPAAVALGKLGDGVKKTMTPAALAQRQSAAKLALIARLKNKSK